MFDRKKAKQEIEFDRSRLYPNKLRALFTWNFMPTPAYSLKICCYVSRFAMIRQHVEKFRNGKSRRTHRKRVLISQIWCSLVFGIGCNRVQRGALSEELLMQCYARWRVVSILISNAKFIFIYIYNLCLEVIVLEVAIVRCDFYTCNKLII